MLIGGIEVELYPIDYHDALVSGQPLAFTTTGSADVDPASTTFPTFHLARFTGLENDGNIALDVDTPPVLRTDRPVTLTFDRPLDPGFAYIHFIPFAGAGAGDAGGSRPAVVQPRAPTDRVVIPASALHELVADADGDRTAYVMVIEEIRFANVRRTAHHHATPAGRDMAHPRRRQRRAPGSGPVTTRRSRRAHPAPSGPTPMAKWAGTG